MEQEMINSMIESYCDSLLELVENNENVLGMDDIEDFQYFIEQIKSLVE